MGKVALVAFKGTVAQKAVDLCTGFDKFYVGSSRKAIDQLIGSGVLETYNGVVALGLKNRSKDDFVHVEENAFLQGKVLSLNTKLVDGVLFKKTQITKKLENSWCNILAAQLKAVYPNKSVAFLHIPPKIDIIEVSERLSGDLKKL